MKVTKTQLKQIIKEELEKELEEGILDALGLKPAGEPRVRSTPKALADRDAADEKTFYDLLQKAQRSDSMSDYNNLKNWWKERTSFAIQTKYKMKPRLKIELLKVLEDAGINLS
tara:strand:- start:924 stop:1265 length:342 start_codon:yes stop_codon:yes gene_type:complete